jgi:hypothetical protein
MKKPSKKIQTSTLDTMSMTPPKGGRKVPPGFISYDSTKEEEIEALKLVFRLDGSNPYKDHAYNVKKFAPYTKYDEADYHTNLLPLHSSEMEVENKYVAIRDLMRQMIGNSYIWVPTTEDGSRYQYNRVIHDHLHQSETPEATRRRTGMKTPPSTIETPPRTMKYMEEEAYNFDEKPVQNVWITQTARRAKEREQQMNAREKTKQRLTIKSPLQEEKKMKERPFSKLEDDEEEEEDEETATVVEQMDENKAEEMEELEDTAISRLEVQEQEYLQE